MRLGADRHARAWGTLAALMAAGAWTAVAHGAPSTWDPLLPHALAPLSAQTSDEVIARDLGAIDGWERVLATLPGARNDPWRSASARAWLRAAREEYEDNDRQGFPQAAFAQAVTLIDEIERGAAVATYDNPPPPANVAGSVRVADSLQSRLRRLEHNPGFKCAIEELADMEVELAWAGNEQVDQGTCKTSPHIARAALLAAEAQRKVEGCVPAPVAANPEPEVPVPQPERVPHVPVRVPTAEELRIPRSVHFALGEDYIPTVSHRVIARIANVLRKYPSIAVRLVGHTDSRGGYAYNLALSRRRVDAVRGVLLEMGIDSLRISHDYRGKSQLYSVEDSKRGFALNRRVDMVFVDSEGRDIRATSQEEDLQLESGPAVKHSTAAQATKPAAHRPAAHRRAPRRRAGPATRADAP